MLGYFMLGIKLHFIEVSAHVDDFVFHSWHFSQPFSHLNCS